MKIYSTSIKILIFLIFLIFRFHNLQSQDAIYISNTGGHLIIKDGAYFVQPGNDGAFYLKTKGSSDGKIVLEGTIKLTGDFINQTTTSEVLTGLSQGHLLFEGTKPDQSVIGAFDLNNVTLNNDIIIDGSLEIAGTLTFNDKTINGDGDLALMPSSTAITTHAGGFNGNIQNSGALTLSNSANYTYKGGEEQETGTLLPLTLNNLTVDKTLGNVILSNNDLTEINGSLNLLSGGLIVNSDAQLTVNGGTLIESTKGLILKSDIDGTASFIDDGISGSGTAEVENYLKYQATDFGRYISMPISDGHSDFFNNPAAGLYFYNSSQQGWQEIFDEELDIITGYVTKYPIATTLSYEGMLNTGDLNRTDLIRTTTPNNFGWNLIGNPYPSAADWDLIGKDKVNATMYFRKTDGSIAYYTEGGVGVPSGTTGIIPPMQSFWAQVTQGHTYGSVYFSNATRLHAQQALYKNVAYPILRLRAANSNFSDETAILFNDLATPAFDNQYDAYKLFSQNNQHPQIYSLSSLNEELAINSINFQNTHIIVPLKFMSPENGWHTLDAFEIANMDNNITIHIEDKKTNILQDLRVLNQYKFNYNSSENNDNRFFIHFNYSASSALDDVAHSTNNLTNIYANNASIFISFLNSQGENYTVNIYNLLGQIIYNENISDTKTLHKIDMSNAYAHYIVHIFNNNYSHKEKVTIFK